MASGRWIFGMAFYFWGDCHYDAVCQVNWIGRVRKCAQTTSIRYEGTTIHNLCKSRSNVSFTALMSTDNLHF